LVGIAFLTPEGRFRWANQALLDIFSARGQANVSMEPFDLSREQYLRIGREVDHLHPDDESWRRFGQGARAALIATGSDVCERQLSAAAARWSGWKWAAAASARSTKAWRPQGPTGCAAHLCRPLDC